MSSNPVNSYFSDQAYAQVVQEVQADKYTKLKCVLNTLSQNCEHPSIQRAPELCFSYVKLVEKLLIANKLPSELCKVVPIVIAQFKKHQVFTRAKSIEETFTIVTKNGEVKFNRFLLCGFNDYFKAAATFGNKENNSVDFSKIYGKDSLECFKTYVYDHCLPDTNNVETLVDLYCLGQLIECQPLMNHCLDRLKCNIREIITEEQLEKFVKEIAREDIEQGLNEELQFKALTNCLGSLQISYRYASKAERICLNILELKKLEGHAALAKLLKYFVVGFFVFDEKEIEELGFLTFMDSELMELITEIELGVEVPRAILEDSLPLFPNLKVLKVKGDSSKATGRRARSNGFYGEEFSISKMVYPLSSLPSHYQKYSKSLEKIIFVEGLGVDALYLVANSIEDLKAFKDTVIYHFGNCDLKLCLPKEVKPDADLNICGYILDASNPIDLSEDNLFGVRGRFGYKLINEVSDEINFNKNEEE